MTSRFSALFTKFSAVIHLLFSDLSRSNRQFSESEPRSCPFSRFWGEINAQQGFCWQNTPTNFYARKSARYLSLPLAFFFKILTFFAVCIPCDSRGFWKPGNETPFLGKSSDKLCSIFRSRFEEEREREYPGVRYSALSFSLMIIPQRLLGHSAILNSGARPLSHFGPAIFHPREISRRESALNF